MVGQIRRCDLSCSYRIDTSNPKSYPIDLLSSESSRILGVVGCLESSRDQTPAVDRKTRHGHESERQTDDESTHHPSITMIRHVIHRPDSDR